MAANEWFYARDGQKFGPVSGKHLKELATIGVLRRNDLIWSPGYTMWRPAKKFRGLLPKMDATSLSPAMSLFWKPTEADGAQESNKFQGMFLEPDSPATAVTPPLPPTATSKKAIPVTATRSGTNSTAARPTTRRQSVSAAISEVANTPPLARLSASQPTRKTNSSPNPVVVIDAPKAGRKGLSSNEKIAIGAGRRRDRADLWRGDDPRTALSGRYLPAGGDHRSPPP